MKAYSPDLRQRIVHAVIDGGVSQPEAARRFVVSLRTVERYVHQWRTTGDLAARHSPGAPPAIAAHDYPALIAQLAAGPDARLADHCARWERERGTKVSTTTMQRLTRSPDLNPIEQAFSKVKAAVRRAEARTHEALVDAYDGALGRVTQADAHGWITHSGYRLQPRLPL